MVGIFMKRNLGYFLTDFKKMLSVRINISIAKTPSIKFRYSNIKINIALPGFLTDADIIRTQHILLNLMLKVFIVRNVFKVE